MESQAEGRRVAVIIEDDVHIRKLLETVLAQAGFKTISRGNGVDGIEAVRTHDPIVTTLDVSMPGMDGFETAKRIREFSSTYLVMLTARDEEIDMLQGLDSGADDYVTKPFRPRELRARIEAMLRRPRVQMNIPSPAQPLAAAHVLGDGGDVAWGSEPRVYLHEDADGGFVVLHNGLRLNAQTRIATLDDTELNLTRSEFDLLAGMLESGRRVRSKEELALVLRNGPYETDGYVSDTDKRAVEVHMANLRRKLCDDAQSPRFVETVRGVGYRLTAQER